MDGNDIRLSMTRRQSIRSVLSGLRRPEHTGERRCWPCTFANGVLLALAVIAITRTRRRALAVCLAAVGTATIALRGYLVPYTPRFAPRLAARLPGDPFHVGEPVALHPPDVPVSSEAAGPETSHSLADEELDGEVVLAALLDAGVLTDDGDTVTLTDDTRGRWRAEMARLRELDMDALAAVVAETAPTAGASSIEGDGNEWVVLTDESGSIGGGVWLSRPVAIAETAAVRALADELDAETRIAAARPLRMFLENCPACGGPVSETTNVQCCGGLINPKIGPQDVIACEACDEWLFTFPPAES